jgi:tetratricopeptide (TPR) repeat protein
LSVVVDGHKSILILYKSYYLLLVVVLLGACSEQNQNSGNTIVHEVPNTELSNYTTQLQVLNAEIDQSSDPQNYFLRSKIFTELGKLDLALSDINNALQQEETNGKFLWWKAEILFRKNKTKEAYELAKRAENLGYKQIELLGTLAAIEIRQKAYKAANTYIETALQAAPYNGYFHYLKGLYITEVKDSATAIEHYKTAIRLKPKFVDSYKKLSEVYHATGRTDLATELSLELAKQYPYDAENNLMLGTIYKQRAKLDTALNYFILAANINPKLYKANLEAGNIYLFYKNYSKALTHYQLCQKENPNRASLYSNLGICFEGLGRYTEALDNYTLAYTQNTTDQTAIAGIGRMEKRIYAASQPKVFSSLPTTPENTAKVPATPVIEIPKLSKLEGIKPQQIKKDSTAFKVRIP